MRTTQATYAVERLKKRTDHASYAAISLPGGLFYLTDRAQPSGTKLCEPLPLEAFVSYVDALSPAKPRKVSKLDIAFEDQIRKSRS